MKHIESEAAIACGVAEFAGGDEVDGKVFLEKCDAQGLPGPLKEAKCDFAPSGVSVVQDAPTGVPAFAPKVEGTGGICIKLNAPLHEFAHPLRSFVDNFPHRLFVAKPGSGIQRVGDMAVKVIVFSHDAGYATLSPSCV